MVPTLSPAQSHMNDHDLDLPGGSARARGGGGESSRWVTQLSPQVAQLYLLGLHYISLGYTISPWVTRLSPRGTQLSAALAFCRVASCASRRRRARRVVELPTLLCSQRKKKKKEKKKKKKKKKNSSHRVSLSLSLSLSLLSLATQWRARCVAFRPSLCVLFARISSRVTRLSARWVTQLSPQVARLYLLGLHYISLGYTISPR